MNINYKEQQFDLFPANSATMEDVNKPRILLASLTLSTESLVILSILGIMIALFSFSLGVERGRSLAAQSLDEKAAAAWNVGGRPLATVATPAVAVKAPVMMNVAKTSSVVSTSRAVVAPRSTLTVKPVAAKAVAVSATGNAVSTGSKWTVQLATYKSEKYAQQEALGFKAKGYPAFLVKSKDFYLVCVGQFSSQAQADSFFKKIQAKHQGSQVRRF